MKNDLQLLRTNGEGDVYLAEVSNNNIGSGEPIEKLQQERMAAVVCYSSEIRGDKEGPLVGVWCTPSLARRINVGQIQSLCNCCSECGLQEITVECSIVEQKLCIYSSMEGNMRATIRDIVRRFIALLQRILSDILRVGDEKLEIIESRLPTRLDVGRAIGIA